MIYNIIYPADKVKKSSTEYDREYDRMNDLIKRKLIYCLF